MNTQPTILQAGAMPPQIITPLAAGATSPMQSAQIQQQQQTDKQMALIGTKGGGKRRGGKRRGSTQRRTKRRSAKRRQFKGGANGVANNAQILVPSVQAGAVNSEQTAGQYADLTALASTQQSQAVYDKGNTASVAAQQGGNNMKGGTWPVWGCLSGGKKTRRKNKRYKKNKRNTKNKRRHH